MGNDYLLPDIEDEFGGRRPTIETHCVHAKRINYDADAPTDISEVGSHLGRPDDGDSGLGRIGQGQ